jgi:hypothetical protein
MRRVKAGNELIVSRFEGDLAPYTYDVHTTLTRTQAV